MIKIDAIPGEARRFADAASSGHQKGGAVRYVTFDGAVVYVTHGELPYVRPAPRSIASHRCIAPGQVTLVEATHSLAISSDTCVLGAYLWFHLKCVFRVFGVERGVDDPGA
jgi:hypothetical protein